MPSRELLAEMLMAIGRPADALAEFEQSLKRDPNRFRAIYGAGKFDAARKHYASLRNLTARRDSDHPEVAHAEDYLARN